MRASTRSPRACSGDMYATVPVTAPGWVKVNWFGISASVISSVHSCHAGIEFRETKIEHLDQPILGDHDVSGLEVAMNNARGMRLRQRVRNLNAISDGFTQFELALLDHRRQRRPAHVLHYDEVGVVLGVDFVDGDDIGMIERGSRHGLTLEAGASSLGQRAIGRKNFDGNVAIKPGIMRAINHAHSACPNIRENVVMREPSANHGFVPR